MKRLPEQLIASPKRVRGDAVLPDLGASKCEEGIPGIGKIKWFGGINRNTGRENDYGFIATLAGDLFFHRSGSLSPPEALIEGVIVAFNSVEGRKGKAAKSVRVMSGMDDEALKDLLKASPPLSPTEVMAVAMHMKEIGPCEEEVFHALTALASTHSMPPSVGRLWAKLVPTGPKDRYFSLAPLDVKARTCKKFYASFLKALGSLFTSVTSTATTISAVGVYRDLDERDHLIAREWAGKSGYDGVMAKMLSARAAEKAMKRFYEGIGANVEDVSIRQLDRQENDWTTHDLLVDSTVPVDVKNARRPVSGKKFYVEHTIPRFKLDRQNVHVRIAGVLSPYINYKYIQNPGEAPFKIEDLIFLGETSRNAIDRLITEFGSSGFEVVRAYEKTVPNWAFAYPEAWYRTFLEDIRRFTDYCAWPDEGDWEFVLDDSGIFAAIPALCVTGKKLPAFIASRLSGWQVEFYLKLQSLVGNFPEMPVIFFAVLTDFLHRLKNGDSHFSPAGYKQLLYPKNSQHGISYPLGAIDPLGLVAGLIQTLSILWKSRESTGLERFSNFRFSGLGILQGRESERQDWTTIIAYCGGMSYQTDDEGKVQLTPEGKPVSIKGKCGNAPLIIGDSATCPCCGKLMCKECGFCSLPCQEQKFSERAENTLAERAEHQRAAARAARHMDEYDRRWVEVPLEMYDDEFRRGR